MTASAATTKRRRVLIVEDNVDAAESLRDLLELDGHEVLVTPNGTEAIVAATRGGADIVLCDLGLPDMTGFDVARALKRNCAFKGTLVALTGYASAADQKLAVEAGFDRHLLKPVDILQIAAIINGQ